MKLWLDLVNSPHVRLFARVLRFLGTPTDSCLLTIRFYGYLEDLAEILLARSGFSVISVGRRGEGLLDKLIAHLDRVRRLAELVASRTPEVAAAKASPELARVAFGLGIPLVVANDNDRSYHVSKLTFPLASAVVIPESFGRERAVELGAEPDSVVSFRGVYEVAHVLDYADGVRWGDPLGELGLGPEEYVVLRPEPKMVSYRNWEPRSIRRLVEAVRRGAGDLKVVAFPRDPREGEILRDAGAIVPTGTLDALSLVASSAAFVGAGGTMTREAALLGVRAISAYPGEELAVDLELERAGIVRRVRRLDRLEIEIRESLQTSPPRDSARSYLTRAEDPAKVLARVIEDVARP